MGSRTEEGSPTDPGCTGAVRLLVWAVDSSRVMGAVVTVAVWSRVLLQVKCPNLWTLEQSPLFPKGNYFALEKCLTCCWTLAETEC